MYLQHLIVNEFTKIKKKKKDTKRKIYHYFDKH